MKLPRITANQARSRDLALILLCWENRQGIRAKNPIFNVRAPTRHLIAKFRARQDAAKRERFALRSS
jgi:hypothetical protein